MLAQSQVDELMSRGITHLQGVVAPNVIGAAEEHVWQFLASRGVDRHDRSTWPDRVDKLQPLRKAGVFDGFLDGALEPVFDQLLGASSTDLGPGPQALLSMPSTDFWTLPHKRWHMDLPGRGPTDRLSALRVLGFVADVEPRGGGTLVVEGSAALVNQLVAATSDNDAGSSSKIRSALSQRHEWFDELMRPGPERIERFMNAAETIDGVDVQVTELTGLAGDITLMHPWTIHNIGANTSDRPRMMMTYSRYRR